MSTNPSFEKAKAIQESFLTEPVAQCPEFGGVGIGWTDHKPNVCAPYCLKVHLEEEIPEDVKQQYKHYQGTFVEFQVTGPAIAY